jgi:hypothetical protein
MKKIYLLAVLTSLLMANEADVLDVKANCNAQRICNFSVTIKHKDSGWEHYVNKYEILDQNGAILGTRVLFHPHVDEQPFTRSLSGVKIPKDVSKVTVRAYDSVHEFGGKEFTLITPLANQHNN